MPIESLRASAESVSGACAIDESQKNRDRKRMIQTQIGLGGALSCRVCIAYQIIGSVRTLHLLCIPSLTELSCLSRFIAIRRKRAKL